MSADSCREDSAAPNRRHDPIALAGPTAVGKSEVALRLAQKLGGEIISVDSMQVYRGLNIGTAKPGGTERAAVTHHLIDIVDLQESFDAARFVELAREAVRQIQSRERIPILCGGTGFYFKALLQGLGDSPPGDPALRAELERTPLALLLNELAERDPVAFGQIDRRNPRRVVRAIEVIRLTGRRFSDMRPRTGEVMAEQIDPRCRLFGLARSPEDLRKRINVRVDAMFAQGLVEETRALLERGLESNRTAMQALGYRQVVDHLKGDLSMAETIALVKQRTWQFARRQMTWFRRQLPVTWIQWEADGPAEEVASQVMAMLA